ncbi:LPXTG cell wall anchor domain-containing protein [Brevibacterium zhoupengii]|uniref:LPXTG cell wall anchor domain-containing protein n=1 Tax=Brevibacterium zhoupengii TaxID=2898795 RepID=UPI001E4B9B98|nr:LPXTG cell wall anchor domain-containing protein [Brevibacterium zhoupengii]
MQKKLVQSSLALAAAAALGLSGAFVASPAAADKPDLNVETDTALQTAVHKNLADKNGELASEVGRFGVQGDTLVLGVSEKTDKVKELASKYDNVEVIVDPKFVEAEPQDAKDLVGGAGYMLSVPSDENLVSACSTGFAGWDSSGNQVVLTAGHCAVDSTTGAEDKILDLEKPSAAEAAGGEGFLPAGTGSPGTWGFHQYGSDIVDNEVVDEDKAIDFAVIKVADGFTTKAEVTDWTTAKDDDLSLSTTEMAQVGTETPGATIHKSGRTTGVTEGTVLDDPDAFEYANIGGRAVHGFEVTDGATRFSDHGDSGGAVYQGDTAVGVISGGPEAGGWSWVADLDNSIAKSGETFTFEDPNETPEAPEAPVAESQTIESNGSVVGKAVPNADVKISWAAAEGQVANQMAQAEPQGAPEGEETVTADAEGNFTIEGPEAEGKYSYSATAVVDGQESAATEFEVTVEAADEAEAEATAEADADAGVEADAAAGGDDANADSAADGAEADAGADGADAGADGAEADADGNDSDAGAGADAKNAESNADSDGSKDGEAPEERKLSIEPKEVSASDFVKQDKGVQILAAGFEEGEKVSLEVVAGPENVEGITLDETANADGVAAFSIYGTSASDPSVYLGKYNVEVTGANDTEDESALTGSFEVVADEDGNGGGGNDDGDNGDGGDGGSDLPRTGAELTGLAAGAGLLVVGGAAVVLTMRRKKNN